MRARRRLISSGVAAHLLAIGDVAEKSEHRRPVVPLHRHRVRLEDDDAAAGPEDPRHHAAFGGIAGEPAGVELEDEALVAGWMSSRNGLPTSCVERNLGDSRGGWVGHLERRRPGR